MEFCRRWVNWQIDAASFRAEGVDREGTDVQWFADRIFAAVNNSIRNGYHPKEVLTRS